MSAFRRRDPAPSRKPAAQPAREEPLNDRVPGGAEINSNEYLLMDRSSMLIAHGELQSPPDSHNMQIRITQGSVEDVVAAELIQAVSASEDGVMELGQVIFRRGNLVVLEPLERLGREVRRNLRVPVAFTSYIYPPSGGRAVIQSADLSCGGIAFRTRYLMAEKDQVEIVIPITLEEPLILRCQILRARPEGDGVYFYAAKFLDMIHDEEAMMRAAVFSVQLQSNAKSRKKEKAR